MSVSFIDLGLIDYQHALETQLQAVQQVQADSERAQVLICAHPPVVTLGRSTQPGEVSGWTGQTVEISRGGRATYHGPEQFVVYPIVSLKAPPSPIPKMDLHKYMRFLEDTVIRTLQRFDVKAESRQTVQFDENGRKIHMTGVWVGEKKIASIGIGVKKWVSYHGIAVNLNFDPQAFKGINPCGFSTETMTSVEELTGQKVDRGQFAQVYQSLFLHP